jgi:TolB protein
MIFSGAPKSGCKTLTTISRITILLGLLLSLTACTRAAGQIEQISVSPDGTLIALAYRTNDTCLIYKVPIDGGVVARLTQAKAGWEFSPAFSDDGKLIAYSYDPGKSHSQIVVVNSDGSNARFFHTADGDDSYPVFAPKSGGIYFARSRYFGSYSPIATPHPHEWDIFSADLDGNRVKQLTHERYYQISRSSLSPDGKRLMFQVETQTGSKLEIHSLDQASKPVILLQPHVPGQPRLGPALSDPQFLPGGQDIVFMAASEGKSGYDYDVYRMDLATGALKKLTDANGYSTGLTVSANGRAAALLKWTLDWHKSPVASQVYLLDLQTHSIKPIQLTGLK